MSLKTYVCYKAGYTGFQYYPQVPGQDGLIGLPLGESEVPYRSRLGYPSHGSGPWFTAWRDSMEPDPSTDGLFSLGVGNGQFFGGGREAIQTMGSDCRVISDKGRSRRADIIEYLERHIYKVEKISATQYRLYYHGKSWRWPGTPVPSIVPQYPAGCPFIRKSGSQMVNSRDYSFAMEALDWGSYAMKSGILQLRSEYDGTINVYTTGSNAKYGRVFQADLSPDPRVFSEDLYLAQQYVELGILPNSWAMGLEAAYVEACKNLPQAATNVAANVLEAASTLANIWHGNFGAVLPKTAKDAWLFYRYAYTTSKLDVQELRSTIGRLDDLLQLNIVKAYGSYARDGTEYRVGFDIDTAQIIPRDVSTTLKKFGLELNFLNAWDMIPYSFVVDWFLPVASIIEYFQDLDACKYEPQDLWWSLVTTRDGHKIYSRLPGRKLFVMPYLHTTDVSRRTIYMRIADAVALFS